MALKITDLLGSYDNFNEEPGYLNNPQNILAITITFMVSDGVLTAQTCPPQGERLRAFLSARVQICLTRPTSDLELDMRLTEIIHPFLHCSRSRMG